MPDEAIVVPRFSLVRWSIATLFLGVLLASATFGGSNRFLLTLQISVWAVAFLFLVKALAKASDWIERKDLFSPFVAFPLGYLLWFAIASVDLVDVPPSVSFGLFEPIPGYLWFYILIGLAAYILGGKLARPGHLSEDTKFHCRWVWAENRFLLVLLGLVAMMVTSYVYIILQIGVPALSQFAGEVRLEIENHGVAQAFLFSSAWTIILFLLAYVWVHPHSRSMGFLCWAGVVVSSVFLLSLGGRTQFFVPLITALVLRHYIKSRFRLRKLVVVLMIIFCFISAFGYLRDTALSGGNAADQLLNIPAPLLPFVYAYLYIRYPVATFREVTTAIPKTAKFQYGALSLGPLDTLLPGRHQQSDMFFKQMLGSEFTGAGQPATLLGPLYADGGAIGIVIGMFLFGLITATTYRWMLSEPTVFRVLIYAWVVQTGIFSYFSNLFPYITTLWMPLMWLVSDRIMRVQRHQGLSTQQATVPTVL
jgi:oligosaccharide repeat unit polymerase